MRRLIPLLGLLAMPLHAATYTVTNSAATGPGTFHQAVGDATANPGTDTIVFDVASSTLPPLLVVNDPVIIDGALPTGRVLLEGGTLHFTTSADGSILRNVFSNVPDSVTGPGHSLTLVNNVLLDVVLHGGNLRADDNDIRTLTATGGNALLLGNTIDTLITSGSNSQIGGLAAGESNTIGSLSVTNSVTVTGNVFTPIAGGPDTAIEAYGGPGVQVFTQNTINAGYSYGITARGRSFIHQNDITASVTGIRVGATTGVTISQNDFFGAGLPIDLGSDGPTPNDPAPDADTGSNNLQNFPVLTSAVRHGTSVTVQGTLASVPLTFYSIEFFANRIFIGSTSGTTDAAGMLTFNATLNPVPAGATITATATSSASTNDTSEMSAAIIPTQPGTLGFNPVTYSVNESAGTVTLTVARTGGSDGTVTVSYQTVGGTATAGGDFGHTSGILSFGPGVTSQTIIVPIVNDGVPEPAEQFTVQLSGATGGALIGMNIATVVIETVAETSHNIPTASTWGLIALGLALAAITLSKVR